MDPEMAKLAMEQMSKMTPDQMAKMQQQMSSISPDMMQAAMARMNNMSAADKAKMRDQMSGMDPSKLGDMGAQASSQFAAQQDYALQASTTLKNEGNALHKQQRFKDAAEKYRRAYDNMQASVSADGVALRKACALNLASCNLKLGDNSSVVSLCTEVLSSDPGNIKALYRRGQAYTALGGTEDAAKDLQAAVKVSPADAAIQEKLDEVKGKLKAEGKTLPAATPVGASLAAPSAHRPPPPGNPAQAASMMKDPNTRKMMADMMKNMSDEDMRRMAAMSGAPPGMSIDQMRKQYEMLEKMDETEINQMAEAAQSMQGGVAPSSAARPAVPAVNPDQMKNMQKMMAENPGMMSKMMESIGSLPQEQLDQIAKASGAPPGMKLSPEMIKQTSEMMSKMSPEEMRAAASTSTEASKTSAPASRPPVGDMEIEDITGREDEYDRPPHAAPATSGAPPGNMATMMSNMSQEQLDSMAQMSGVPGMNITPEMAQMASSMMANMSSEDIMRMQQMSAGMRGPAGAGVAGPAGMSADQQAKMAQDMMGNPETMKMMTNMLKNVDPKTLAAMSQQAGMGLSEEQAEKMAKTLQDLPPEHMERLMKVSAYAQKGMQKMKQTKDFVMSKSMFWISLVMLLTALVLRYLGYM